MQSRRVDDEDHLIVRQEWGDPKGRAFVATYKRLVVE
jgi:hypothetical protein